MEDSDRSTHFRAVQEPYPWRRDDPPIRVARSGSGGFYGLDAIHPIDLAHVLILGGTGSGKTRGTLEPLLRGMYNYTLEDGTAMSLLVVDPKKELTANLMRGSRPLTVIGECPPIRCFAAGLPPGDIVHLLRELLGKPAEEGRNRMWVQLADSVLESLLRLESDYAEKVPGASLIAHLAESLDLPMRGEFWLNAHEVLAFSRRSYGNLRKVALKLRFVLSEATVQSESANLFADYSGSNELIEQWNYVLMSLDPVVKTLCDKDFRRVIDASPSPRPDQTYTDLRSLVNDGAVVLFHPSEQASAAMAARVLKSQYYSAVFSRADMRRPVGVVIDEAHRFVTSDPNMGEAALLDRCRAFRTNVVLATQTVAALEHAMGSGPAAQNATRVLIANTPSRWFMRSTEAETPRLLRGLLPPPPWGSGEHVVDVRPPSQLRAGEAYWMLASGEWGRGQAELQLLNEGSTRERAECP